MKTTLLTSAFLIIILSTKSQVTFQKTYGGNGYDFGLSVQQTTDEGYILFGSTNSFGNGSQDMYLIKTDYLGNELWSQTYGGPDWEFGISAQQTTDGGYILCGAYSGVSDDTLTMIKTDQNGNEIWNKRYSGTVDRDVGQFVQQTSDGGFLAVGFTGPSFNEHIYMVKTDFSGNKEWSQVHESNGREYAVGVRETVDGGYILVGQTNNTPTGSTNMLLTKTDSSGDILWSKTFGTSSDEIGRSIYITDDNGFIILGYEDFAGGNLYLVKTDFLGNEEWSKYYGETGWDTGHSVQQTSDGGYILAGRKQDTVSDENHMYSIKTDPIGNVEWEYTYPNGIMSDASSLDQTSDGGYILLGSSLDTTGVNNTDFYLVKTNGIGYASIDYKEIQSLKVNAYPNPFTEYTTIELNDTRYPEFSVSLINSNGQVVKPTLKSKEGKVKIEREGLTSGLYYFKLTSKGQPLASGKLILE